ncbi:MAG TPA: NUDIX hydrolase [Candidatus Sulfotelmatobacter sp.]|jgi:8-oxo-dGTP diphosphatase|nr:NUDIX hydrolase [Candidatus Sulfotelmatobacter sp.]
MDKKQIITACIFLHKNGKVLIGKRADTKLHFPGKWELPGGHIEFGETVEEGLKRELQEEFQIDIVIEKLYYEFTWIGNNEHIIEVLYTGHMINPSQKIVMNRKELADFRWIDKEEVATYFADNDAEGRGVTKGFEALGC